MVPERPSRREGDLDLGGDLDPPWPPMRWTCTLVLVTLLGCGGTPPPTVRATPEPEPELRSPGAAPTLVEGRARYLVADGDGWVGARGVFRLRADASGVRVAAFAFGSEIVRITHLGSAWLFVTREEVLRASDPLGDVDVVSTLDGVGVGFVVAHRHRLAIVDYRGDLWVGDGDGVARAPSDVPIVDAAFASASLGVRIELPGRLSRTTDGGRTWTALTLPAGALPYEVTDAGADVLVRAAPSEQRFLVHAAGEVERLTAEPALDRPTAPPDVIAALEAYEGTLHTAPLEIEVPARAALPEPDLEVVVSCGERPAASEELAQMLAEAHVPEADLVESHPIALSTEVASGTRRVVSRCEGRARSVPCDAVWLGGPRQALVIPMLRLLADTFATDPDITGALALEDGRMALLVSSERTEGSTHAPPTDVVVTFAIDGTMSTFQLVVGWAPSRRELALAADGRIGIVVAHQDRVTFLGTDGSVASARVPGSCRSPTR